MNIMNKAGGLVFLVTLVLVSSVCPAHAEFVLFDDNFNTTVGADTYGYAGGFGLNQELAIRQSGTYGSAPGGPTSYVRGGGDASWYQVNNAGLGAGKLALLAGTGGDIAVSPNVNFNGSNAAGGLKISFDAKVSQTAYLRVGASTPIGGDYQFVLGILTSGSVFFVDTAQPGTPANFFASVSPSVQNRYELVFTGVGDGNPFDGTGQVNIAGYINNASTPAFTWTKLGAGSFANNYIALSGQISGVVAWNTFDNLRVAIVPEPSTLALLAAGLLGSAAYAWRKRTQLEMSVNPGGM